MDESPSSAPSSPAPAAIRSKELGSVLRDIREKLDLVPLVRPPPLEDDEPVLVIDLLKHTPDDLPVSDPPRAVRPGRTITASRTYTRRPPARP